MNTEPIHPLAAMLNERLTQATGNQSPQDRAVAALEAYEWTRTAMLPEIAAIRRGAVRELRSHGYSLREVADMLGVTEARISQITGA